MKLIPISEFKKNASNLDLSEDIGVTQNGIPVMVVRSYDAHKQREELIASIVSGVKSDVALRLKQQKQSKDD